MSKMVRKSLKWACFAFAIGALHSNNADAEDIFQRGACYMVDDVKQAIAVQNMKAVVQFHPVLQRGAKWTDHPRDGAGRIDASSTLEDAYRSFITLNEPRRAEMFVQSLMAERNWDEARARKAAQDGARLSILNLKFSNVFVERVAEIDDADRSRHYKLVSDYIGSDSKATQYCVVEARPLK